VGLHIRSLTMNYPERRRTFMPASCDTPDKQFQLFEYLLVQADFIAELLAEDTDWEMLFSLHFNLQRREKRFPWLKTVLLDPPTPIYKDGVQ
jgi:hypothetical protein